MPNELTGLVDTRRDVGGLLNSGQRRFEYSVSLLLCKVSILSLTNPNLRDQVRIVSWIIAAVIVMGADIDDALWSIHAINVGMQAKTGVIELSVDGGPLSADQ